MKHIMNLLKPYFVLFGMILLVIISFIIILPFTTTIAKAIHFLFAIAAFKFLYHLLDKAIDKITKDLNK